jgi:hypothetical protein
MNLNPIVPAYQVLHIDRIHIQTLHVSELTVVVRTASTLITLCLLGQQLPGLCNTCSIHVLVQAPIDSADDGRSYVAVITSVSIMVCVWAAAM